MKKLLSVMIVFLAVGSLCSCGTNQKSETDSNTSTSETSTSMETTKVVVENKEISNDALSGQVMINGVLLTLPCKTQELINLGFSLNDWAKETIGPSSMSETWLTTADGDELTCSVYSLTDKKITQEDSMLYSITFEDELLKNTEIVFPGKFTFDTPGPDAIALFTPPIKIYDDSFTLYVSARWENEDVMNGYRQDIKYRKSDLKITEVYLSGEQ